ncbi:MAG: hypothetical protein VB106_05595 [Clostridiaceae bacterium]|nr:hypothetical protein [Clostridiaceae bacterium]
MVAKGDEMQMYVQVSDKKDIDWDDFFNGGVFEEISKGKNKIWFATIEHELGNHDSMAETLIEIDNSKRDILLQADSYLKYCKKKKQKGKLPGDQELKYIAVKYDFVEKILDNNNNLIIIVTAEQFEYDHPIKIDENEMQE